MDLPQYNIIQFPGFIKNPQLPLEEQVKPMLECFGGQEQVAKYFRGETTNLKFSFRPNDKCASPLPVNVDTSKNKILLKRVNNQLKPIGIISKQLSINSIAPFQVLDRCEMNILIAQEQSIPKPLEINTVRMSKIDYPIQVDFRQSKEKERVVVENHPHAIPFRKSKMKGRKEQPQQTKSQSTQNSVIPPPPPIDLRDDIDMFTSKEFSGKRLNQLNNNEMELELNNLTNMNENNNTNDMNNVNYNNNNNDAINYNEMKQFQMETLNFDEED